MNPVSHRSHQAARPKGGFLLLLLAALALEGIVAGLAFSRLRARNQVLASEAERSEAEWNRVASQLAEAKSAQPRLETALLEFRRLQAELAAPGWAPALRSVAAHAGSAIALADVVAAGKSGAGMLRVEGTAAGPEPRLQADRYRQSVQKELTIMFGTPVEAEFDRMEDDPLAPPDQPRTGFAMKATWRGAAAPDAGIEVGD